MTLPARAVATATPWPGEEGVPITGDDQFRGGLAGAVGVMAAEGVGLAVGEGMLRF